ncbi:MAG: NUDIX hydrolase [Candidatus Nanoarchaeia archaeon]
MTLNRKKLPYRKNCEGYFLYKNKYIIAKDTRKGYILFPGGGIDEGESPRDALLRESLEEAGIICKAKLKKVKILYFDWEPTWAKTAKQKSRYNKFRGEEMHFFIGVADKLVKPKGDPTDAWRGKKYLLIKDVIKLIENEKPFSKEIKKYRMIQLKYLHQLLNNKV